MLSPSACFQGVDTLRIASKHAEGMSLRYDAKKFDTPQMFPIAYCQKISEGAQF